MPGVVKSKAKGSRKEPVDAFSLSSDKSSFNPALASLFASSAGPVKAQKNKPEVRDAQVLREPKSSNGKPSKPTPAKTKSSKGQAQDEQDEDEELEDDVELSEASEEFSDPSDDDDDDEQDHDPAPLDTKPPAQEKRKRKRGGLDDDLESAYFEKLAREEAKEEKAAKRPKHAATKAAEDEASDEEQDSDNESADAAGGLDEAEDDLSVPVHESLAPSGGDLELDKASRTVFLANVSTTAILSKSSKKTLLNHLASFLQHLPIESKGSKGLAVPHKVESLRFRSTAFSSAVPKKAAFAKKEIMDETSKSTNAYAVYTTKLAAREAAKRLNGTVVLGRHLRVDSVAHPAQIDHRRCVFVGNLGFIDDETNMRAVQKAQGDNAVRKPQTGDVEEGLWVQFSKAGRVESVRVVRDPKTRVGKGFAYVQFADQNGVEAALLFNEKKFPPLLPRKLRVSRAKKNTGPKPESKSSSKGPLRNGVRTSHGGRGQGGRIDPEQQSFKGRAAKLLGRAGAAGMKTATQSNTTPLGAKGTIKAPESFVFEGHRASSSQGNKGLRLGKGSGKKKDGRPRNRSAKRGAEWKEKAAK